MTYGHEQDLTGVIDEPRMSDGDRERHRTYTKEFAPGIVVYVVAVFATSFLVGDDPSVGRRLLLLIPLIPAVWSARAIARWVQRGDEYQRLVQLEALAVGFGAAMIGAMTVGLIGMHAEPNRFNQLSPWFVYMIGMAAWAITLGVKNRRDA